MNLKERLKNNERVYGTVVRIQQNPAICTVAKDAGLDYLLFDCEHGIYNHETLHHIYQMGQAVGLSVLLRVPMLDKESVSRSLDAGAKGVMVPMTDTPEQAREIVHWAKYPPVGCRGYGSGIGAVGYHAAGDIAGTMEKANDEILAIAQIETPLAVDNADAIAATEGIDALVVGPNDLSVALGIPGQMTDEREVEAIRRVAEACKKHGKAFGIHGPDALQKIFAKDVTLCMYTTDVDLLRNSMKDMRSRLESFLDA